MQIINLLKLSLWSRVKKLLFDFRGCAPTSEDVGSALHQFSLHVFFFNNKLLFKFIIEHAAELRLAKY